MATKKAKEAKVEIILPDGTKISARGPMAEQMARRLMDAPPRYTWWPWYTTTSAYGNTATTGTLTVATNGVTSDATPEQVQAAIADGLGGTQ